jgi:hypothetical protein
MTLSTGRCRQFAIIATAAGLLTAAAVGPATAGASPPSRPQATPAGETWCADPGVLEIANSETETCYSDAGNWGADMSGVDYLASGNNAGYLIYQNNTGDWTFPFSKWMVYSLGDLDVIGVHIN